MVQEVYQNGTNLNFVYIRIGATAYGSNFKFVGKDGKADTESVEAEIRAVRAYIRKCEEYKIPYGFYYFSQAINEDETAQEIEFIKYVLTGMGELKYNVLPFALDVEKNTDGTRILKYASQSESAMVELTNLKQKMMEKLRKVLGQDVVLYTDHNALKEILNLNNISSKNLEDMWIVDFGSSHSKDILEFNILNYIGNRQIAENGSIDIDFMNTDRFLSYIKKLPDRNERTIETIIGEVKD
jgi:GH25 family lysozyme M1 (1,4-beta-N-acetylmuramidase)